MDVLKILSAVSGPIVLVAAFFSFYVRSQADFAVAGKIEILREEIARKIDGLKDSLAAINTGLRVSEERHTALAERVARLEPPPVENRLRSRL